MDQSPHFTTNRFGSDAIGYYASSASGQMVVQETFGGKLAENATQAIARDILANALMMLEAHGYPVVFHIHDEAVIEMPIGQGSLDGCWVNDDDFLIALIGVFHGVSCSAGR